MSAAATKHEWSDVLNFYSERNRGRLTRLGVFDGGDDYWIESDLPLAGIAVDAGPGEVSVQIMLESYTHMIKDARSLCIRFGIDGEEDGLDVTDASGSTTILRFQGQTDTK
jgi:hypothetical protein